MEVAKQDIQDDLRKLQKTNSEEDQEVQERGRQAIMRKLAKLKPGGTTKMQALKQDDGNVLTTPEEMAK